MLPIANASWPFILHFLVEFPAILAFGLFPSATLRYCQPHAHAVIRQYALLLLSMNIIVASFILLYPDANPIGKEGLLERRIAGSLALYHLGPSVRAICRIRSRDLSRKAFRRQPWLHAAAHIGCFAALVGRSLRWW